LIAADHADHPSVPARRLARVRSLPASRESWTLATRERWQQVHDLLDKGVG
jgi:hypothetical protein